MNATAIPVQDLACQLLDAVSGIPADAAAAGLIISHGHFLHRQAFRRVITAGTSISTGQPLAVISWHDALHALEGGLLPCASCEQAVLRIAASLGDPAIPFTCAPSWATSTRATSPWSPTPSQPPTANPARQPPHRLTPPAPRRPGPLIGCRTPCWPSNDLPAAPGPLPS
jgi:hypothetical protein